MAVGVVQHRSVQPPVKGPVRAVRRSARVRVALLNVQVRAVRANRAAVLGIGRPTEILGNPTARPIKAIG